MKSWKTTLAGLAAALGMASQTLEGPPWLKIVGLGVSVLGLAVLGMTARDNDVTSEQAGAKK